MFMMIDGILVIAVLLIVIAVYVVSVKGAMAEYKEFCRNGSLNRKKAFISGKAFPIAGLAPALILMLVFVVVPWYFQHVWLLQTMLHRNIFRRIIW